MKYLSVCAGIEAATVAWHPLGWHPVAFSEIEKFPSAVLAHHYPDVPNYGDMTDHEQWPETDIDVLVGGTPCQSFSVAGLRKGMADPRGNLALVYLAIADQFRPRWLVWENVPGVLSSDGGRDFGSIIGGMVELGYSPSWRVLDAQYFGLAQRRKRVFVVASSRDWTDSAKVLFEPACLQGHPAPSREAGQNATGTLEARPSCGSKELNGVDLIPETSLCLNAGGMGRQDLETETMIAYTFKENMSMPAWGKDISETLQSSNFHAVAFAEDHHGARSNDPELEQMLPMALSVRTANTSSNGIGVQENVSHTLDQTAGPAVAIHGGSKRKDRPDGGFYVEDAEVSKPLDTAGLNPTANQGGIAIGGMAVRRLTPLECERLQGFPDNYTNIPGASDGARCKALGNSMAVPVMHWIGARINEM